MASQAVRLAMFESMLKIRCFENKIKELSSRDLLGGAAHLYIGQEAIAVGVCSALNQDDCILSTHRGHGHCIAKGGRLDRMMAELLGKKTGYCEGKGGSMHIADFDLGICGANGIVGGGLPVSVGIALALKKQNKRRIAVCFFGDGAANQGAFHEALNLAALWNLPVLYVCENNQYAISTHVSRATAIEDIARRAEAYGLEGRTCNGNDVTEVFNVSAEIIAGIRRSSRPVLLECKTYRVDGHYCGDPCAYRDKAEVKKWTSAADPLSLCAAALQKEVLPRELDLLKARVGQEMEQAVDYALHSPEPDREDISTNLFQAAYVPDNMLPPAGSRLITFREALNEAMQMVLERDDKAFIIGEDVGRHGGAFAVTQGLFKRFGADRVMDTPISEAAIAGAVIGAAAMGYHPLGELMYIDFITLAMDQIVNQAAKMHYMFGGKIKLPFVLRLPCGSGGRGNAAQHSQSLEAWFMHVPGLKIVMPSDAYDAKGLLLTAVKDENPVLFIEHKVLYNEKTPCPEGYYEIPLGQASIKRPGKDLTLVATARMLRRSLEAASQAAAEYGLEAEVIDPRTLVPFDRATVAASLKKTGKLLVVTEECGCCSTAAEIITMANEDCFDFLDAPPERLCGLDVPIPYNRSLEHLAVPSVRGIAGKIAKIGGPLNRT